MFFEFTRNRTWITRLLINTPKKSRIFSSINLSEIRGTIPFLGQGVAIGQYAEVERCFSAKEVEAFGDLARDKNILHSAVNWNNSLVEMPHLDAVQKSGLIRLTNDHTAITKPVVHGIFVSSLISSIFGTLSPGCVYMNQTLHFVNPVFVDERVLARLEIEKIRKWRRGGVVVQCNTTISLRNDDATATGTFEKPAITGVANVWLPSGHAQ